MESRSKAGGAKKGLSQSVGERGKVDLAAATDDSLMSSGIGIGGDADDEGSNDDPVLVKPPSKNGEVVDCSTPDSAEGDKVSDPRVESSTAVPSPATSPATARRWSWSTFSLCGGNKHVVVSQLVVTGCREELCGGRYRVGREGYNELGEGWCNELAVPIVSVVPYSHHILGLRKPDLVGFKQWME